MIFAISVFVMSAGGNSIVAVTGADMASLGNNLMGGFQGVMAAQQLGKQADQSAADLDRQMEEANKAANDAMEGQEVKPPVVLPTIKGNYPIIDPFANPQYWNARTTQYQASMQAAATNSKIMNQAAVEAIDAEFQQTKMMMQTIGGVMEKGGSMMQEMGAEMAKQEKLDADKEKSNFVSKVATNPDAYTRSVDPETGQITYTEKANPENKTTMSAEEEKALWTSAQTNTSNKSLDAYKNQNGIGWSFNGKTYAPHQEAQLREDIKAEEARLEAEEAEKPERQAYVRQINNQCTEIKVYLPNYKCPSVNESTSLDALKREYGFLRDDLSRAAKANNGSTAAVTENLTPEEK
jgi:hypothetical protein